MKTTTSKLLAAAITLVLIVFVASAFKRTGTGNKYLTIRTIEVFNGLWDSKIVTLYEDGKIEEIELEKFRSRNFSENSKKINDAINNAANKGYTLVSSGGGAGDGVITNSFIFVKN